MRFHGLAVLCLPTLLAAPAALALEDLGECYAIVEAYHHALVEDNVPESRTGALEESLGDVITACESDNLPLAAAHLEVAKVHYDALFAGSGAGQGVTDADFWSLADYMWGNGSHRKGVEVLQFDITGDGDTDQVGYYENHDNPDGPFFQVLVVSRPAAGGDLEYAYISLPYDDGSQFSLCGHAAGSAPTQLLRQEFGPDETSHFSMPVARTGAIIDDGMCDTIRLFWPTDMAGEPEDGLGTRMPLVLDRN